MPVIDKVHHMNVAERTGAVLWISFLITIPICGVFFSAIDPMILRGCVDLPDVSPLGIYTMGFFLIWVVIAASCLIAVYFVYPTAPETSDWKPN